MSQHTFPLFLPLQNNSALQGHERFGSLIHPDALQAPSRATTCCGSSFCQPAKSLSLISKSKKSTDPQPHFEQGAPWPFLLPQQLIKSPHYPALKASLPMDGHSSSSDSLRSPNPPGVCRGGPAKIPAASLTSIVATYPCRLPTASLGSHPWHAWAPLATAAHH